MGIIIEIDLMQGGLGPIYERDTKHSRPRSGKQCWDNGPCGNSRPLMDKQGAAFFSRMGCVSKGIDSISSVRSSGIEICYYANCQRRTMTQEKRGSWLQHFSLVIPCSKHAFFIVAQEALTPGLGLLLWSSGRLDTFSKLIPLSMQSPIVCFQ